MEVTEWDGLVRMTVSKYARGVSKEQKEDLIQDCYVKLLEEEVAIGAAEDPRQFVFKICQHHIINSFRCSESLIQQSSAYLEDAAAIPDTAPRTTFGVSDDDLNRAIGKLTDLQQYVIRSMYFVGRSSIEVGEAMAKSQRTVWRIHKEATEKLKELLEKQCSDKP